MQKQTLKEFRFLNRYARKQILCSLSIITKSARINMQMQINPQTTDNVLTILLLGYVLHTVSMNIYELFNIEY